MLPTSFAEASTLSMYLTGIVGIALIVCISRPLTPLRVALIISVFAMMIIGGAFFRDFFRLAPFTTEMLVFLAVAGIIALALFLVLYRRANDDTKQHRIVDFLVSKVGETS